MLGGWRSSRGLVLIADAHTGLGNVTDAGLKAFSAALGSNTTITTVMLTSKSEWLVTLASVGSCVGVHARVLGRRRGLVWRVCVGSV